MTGKLSLFAFLLFLAFSLPILAGCQQEEALHGTELQEPPPAPDFRLTDLQGNVVSPRDFAGKVVLLYFGYTYCPDVCPTTMADLGAVQRAVDDDGRDLQVIMVTVDPERDTSQIVQDYAAGFHPSFIGLSGTPEEIAAAAQAWGVFFQKQEGSAATGYLVDHTSRVFLVDKAGNYRLSYAFGTPREEIISDLEILLKEE